MKIFLSGRVRWTDLTPAEWRDWDERAVAQLKATGIAQPFQKEYFRKDGSRVPVLVGGAMFEGSGNEGVGFVLDLSEQKSGEEALRRSEAYLAQAQRLSRTGSFWWKVSSGELIWSDEAFRIMGYDRTVRPTVELVFERVHPEDLQIVRHLVSRAAREGSNMDFEHRLLMPDGAVKHVHFVIEAVCLDPENREFVGTVAMEYAANNIRFNTVSPGNINTPMHAQDHHEALAKFHPIARMGEISDIVDAVLYLQNATFVTGENIRVDGGVHAGR